MYTNCYRLVGIASDHLLVNALNLAGVPNPVIEVKVLSSIHFNFHLEEGLTATQKYFVTVDSRKSQPIFSSYEYYFFIFT
jgi:hypothetical protein